MKNSTYNNTWILSKQDERSIAALLDLEYNYRHMDRYLKSKVTQYVKDYNTYIGKALFKTKNILNNNHQMTFAEYVYSVKEVIAYNNDDLSRLIDDAIEVLLHRNPKMKEYDVSEIRKVILNFIFYQPYTAYMYEYRVEETIAKDSRYEIYKSWELDGRYAIDLLVEDKQSGRKIGIQVKGISYIFFDSEKKAKYLAKNQKAIEDGVCDDVYYTFHNNDCNSLELNFSHLTHYESACNYKDEAIYYISDLDKWFISDLESAFDKLLEEENN